MNFKRFFAVFKARNIEFFRDKSSLSWNLFFPVLLLAGFSVIFSGNTQPEYKVGIYQQTVSVPSTHAKTEFEQLKYVEFIHYENLEYAEHKLSRHALDLLVDFDSKKYWVNNESPKSYLIEKILLSQHPQFERLLTHGKAIRYIDWVLPGIIAMNMMFSSLFGVGYAIVRYRKNSVLKRLKATPLSAFEFVSAQLLSRLFIVMFMSSIVYLGCNWFFDFYMLGSYFDLFIVGCLGAICLISLGLLVASRSKSEELIGGLLNLSAWPMMIMSGVWFSLEGSPDALLYVSNFMPLTHIVSGARAIITEGASLADISFHLTVLAIMSSIFLSLGAYLFSWNTKR